MGLAVLAVAMSPYGGVCVLYRPDALQSESQVLTVLPTDRKASVQQRICKRDLEIS